MIVPRVVVGIVSLAFALGAAGWWALGEAGGAFDHEPEGMSTGLGPEARRLLEAAYADVAPEALVDWHVHVVGLGTNGSGAWVNPKMLSWSDPLSRIKGLAYLSGSDVTDLEQADEQYASRLRELARNGRGGRHVLLAFDRRFDENGDPDLEHSEFYTPNDYVFELARGDPDVFLPAISVHPHRPDAVDALHRWADRGVRVVKWLPNAMGIDASDPRHDDYYRALAERNMVLLTHVGEEQAVEAEEDQRLGNPLLFRRSLDAGVTVVMAHSASLGTNEDLDHPGIEASNFELFLRLMDEHRYRGLLYGELSAMTQVNRLPDPLIGLLDRSDLHHRIVNGSDYPLPAINIVIQTRALVRHGLITESERAALNEIYDYNPLIFDFAVKRTLRSPKTGQRFPASVFTGADLGDPVQPAAPEPRLTRRTSP